MTETPLITISGRIASGTSTVADHLSDTGFEVVSGGQIFREQAREKGYTLDEYTALSEEEEHIDRELDNRLKEIAENHATGDRTPDGDGLVLESRICGWIARDYADLTVFLDAPLETRLERVDDRLETISEARQRESSEAARYRHLYGIDMSNLGGFDVVIDTETLSETGVKRVVEHAARDTL